MCDPVPTDSWSGGWGSLIHRMKLIARADSLAELIIIGEGFPK